MIWLKTRTVIVHWKYNTNSYMYNQGIILSSSQIQHGLMLNLGAGWGRYFSPLQVSLGY